MSSIFSWMRRKSLEHLIAISACCATPLSTLAEPVVVRIGPHFQAADGAPFQQFGSVSEVLDRLALDMRQFVEGFDDCRAIVAAPLESGRPRDELRDTWTVIQTIRVECWVLLELEPEVQVSAVGPGALTPAVIYGIMANAELLSSEDEDWAGTLMAFPRGKIACVDVWRCRLLLPDGRNPPEQSLQFDLVMATEQEQFIIVTQMVYGRSGFVYGVMWREAAGKGEVALIFPNPS